MTMHELTELRCAATETSMEGHVANKSGILGKAVLLMAGSIALAGCITVNAPEDAIVIELNINITQEVIYRLAADAGNTIEENADIF